MKEFFSLTKTKIVIVVLIFVFSIFFGFRSVPQPPSPAVDGSIVSMPNKIVFPLSLPVPKYIWPGTEESIKLKFITLGINYLLGIIYWYLISCLIVFLYKKFIPRKKENISS